MTKIELLKGIGPKTSNSLKKIGINEIEDLLYYYPRKYQVIIRSNITTLQDNDKIVIDGIIEGQPTLSSIKSNLKVINFRLSNERNIFNIVIYNQTYLYRTLKIGMKITVIGKYNRIKNTITVSEIRPGFIPPTPKIESIYHTTSDITQKTIQKLIDEALLHPINIKDNIPENLQKKYHFPDKYKSIKEIHHPTTNITFKKSLQRLKYEEFYTYLYKIQQMKKKRLYEEKAIERKIDFESVEKLINELPFNLTKDQKSTILEIKKDLENKIRMNRLIQGDVGSGKTIVALIASYMNYLSGYQTALMVPTEILANQHYQNALSLFKNTKMKIELLTSNIKKIEKDNIYQNIKTGKTNLIIGTQSLIQEKLIYKNLGLIITDEQHRFGVHQRETLKNKGIYPDVLSMSATPIPRTYALTIYGDMDVSSIKTKPSGRIDIITHCKSEKEIKEVLSLMKQEIDKGHQIYIIAPSIENNEKEELNNINTLKEKMNLALGKIAKIGVVHGKLDPTKKNEIMKEFEIGKIKILISTTVIEVGVNVPNASMIVIFEANNFGLSTLHQLRGRVGRGNIQSYCILISKVEQERLKMLETCSDGFKISEYDFKTRGEGDLFGHRQSGEAEFKLANIKKDFDLLVRVKEDVLNQEKINY